MIFRLLSLMVLNITAVIFLYFVTSRLPSSFGRAVHEFISCFFFIIAKILSSIWFTDIANACLRYRGLQTPYLSVRLAFFDLSAINSDESHIFVKRFLSMSFILLHFFSSYIWCLVSTQDSQRSAQFSTVISQLCRYLTV